jgi:hypothetical protein
MGSQRPWTKQEEEELKSLAKKEPLPVIAARLGRSQTPACIGAPRPGQDAPFFKDIGDGRSHDAKIRSA